MGRTCSTRFREWRYRADIDQYELSYAPTVYDCEGHCDFSSVLLNEALALGGDAADPNNAHPSTFDMWTGLADKNGTDIYENDIVEITGMEINGQKTRDVVRLKHGIYEPVAYFKESALKVIGNIHKVNREVNNVSK